MLDQIQTLANRSTFAPGSSKLQFMQRVTDYLEQADPEMIWKKIFQQILGDENNVFEDVDGYGTTLLDPLKRNNGTKTKMMKVSTAPEASQSVVYPMVPGGAATEVTDTNKIQYLDLWLRHKLESEIDESTRWFVKGLISVVPVGVLNMFSPLDLQTLLGGEKFMNDDAKVDLFLDQHVRFTDFNDGDDDLKNNFKQMVRDFTVEERNQLFEFWTSMKRLPVGGLAYLKEPCTVERVTTAIDRLPVSHTCPNIIELPAYVNLDTMVHKFKYAITETEGFGFA